VGRYGRIEAANRRRQATIGFGECQTVSATCSTTLFVTGFELTSLAVRDRSRVTVLIAAFSPNVAQSWMCAASCADNLRTQAAAPPRPGGAINARLCADTPSQALLDAAVTTRAVRLPDVAETDGSGDRRNVRLIRRHAYRLRGVEVEHTRRSGKPPRTRVRADRRQGGPESGDDRPASCTRAPIPREVAAEAMRSMFTCSVRAYGRG
jgi:hypothetical protein